MYAMITQVYKFGVLGFSHRFQGFLNRQVNRFSAHRLHLCCVLIVSIFSIDFLLLLLLLLIDFLIHLLLLIDFLLLLTSIFVNRFSAGFFSSLEDFLTRFYYVSTQNPITKQSNHIPPLQSFKFRSLFHTQ
ncbi:hypothetical protein L6452_36624 [Arctium lappa]|uniref:Uncharacterized protein n=1 Tax=Arctium lappa TaxID=4217 RepID=A0ACB8YAV6_ARCLA|nr:hypothetical protein L6452_36624 [Arctium lappa]